MSAPYTIVNGRSEPLFTLHQKESLSSAISLVKLLRTCRGCAHLTIHGDNVDLDCADGLSDEERDEVQAELH